MRLYLPIIFLGIAIICLAVEQILIQWQISQLRQDDFRTLQITQKLIDLDTKIVKFEAK